MVNPTDGAIGPSINVVSTLYDDEWHFVTGTVGFSGSTTTSKIYLDGVEIGTEDKIFTTTVLNAEVPVIGDDSGGTNVVDGDISDVQIWDFTLSPAEVKMLFLEGHL